VEPYRSAGFFARQRSMIEATGSGTDSSSGVGSSLTIAATVSNTVPRRNGCRPVAIS
jgi:hypothetical protein